MKRFDLVVIGAGPGGYVAAIRAAQLGMRVAVVERVKPGGVCVNWGCIPSKAILTSAILYEDMRNAEAYGIRCQGLSADYGAVIRRSRKVADRMSGGVAYLFKKNKIELFPASATVVSPTTVRAGEEELSAKNILVASGTAVRGLPGIEPDGQVILTSDDALAQETLPRSVIVLGGGAVGVEFERGFGNVDDRLRTACPTIWAIGDVIGGMMLAHKASAEGVVAAEAIAGKEVRRPDPDRISACVFCRPEVATIGLSEEEAKRRGIDYKVSKFPF